MTGPSGKVTLKHKITVPETSSVQVFTPLMSDGASSTSTVDVRVYKVSKKPVVK